MSFVSDAGFLSEPSLLDYKNVTIADDWGKMTSLNLRTTLVESSRAVIGIDLKKHYKVPKDKVGVEHYFGYFTWITQI